MHALAKTLRGVVWSATVRCLSAARSGPVRARGADWPIAGLPEWGGFQAPSSSGFGPAGRDGRISATAIWPSG